MHSSTGFKFLKEQLIFRVLAANSGTADNSSGDSEAAIGLLERVTRLEEKIAEQGVRLGRLSDLIPPVGGVIAFAGSWPKGEAQEELEQRIGWMLCDGRSVDSQDYGELARLFGKRGKFKIPDYQGFFLRGVDHGIGRDSGDRTDTEWISVTEDIKDRSGTIQKYATAKPFNPGFSAKGRTDNDGYHVRPMGEKTGGGQPGTNPANGLGQNVGGAQMIIPAHGHNFTVNISGFDSETRPVNVAVEWLIRFKS